MNWTRRAKAAARPTIKQTVQHYGHPACQHPATKLSSMTVDNVQVLSCHACGQEVRLETIPAKVAFPR